MKPVKPKGRDVYYAMWTCIDGHCAEHDKPSRHWASLRTRDKREANVACNELELELAKQRAQAALGIKKARPATMRLDDFRALYLESTVRDKAETTHKTEACHLGTLTHYAGGERELGSLNQIFLESYKRHRLKQIAPRSWNSELATLKAVFAWGLTRDPPLYERNPFDGVTRVAPGEPTVKKYVSKSDLAKVVASCKDPYWVNVMAFLYATWCRGSELRGLKWDHIHFDQHYLEFVYPKEKRVKVIPITPALGEILRRAKAMFDTEYVFPNPRTRRPLTKDQLHKALTSRGKAVGVKLSPHMCRHSGITDALREGMPLPAVQAQVGHRQITTTAGYNHVDLNTQRQHLEKLHLALTLEEHPSSVEHLPNDVANC
jgi:integrase